MKPKPKTPKLKPKTFTECWIETMGKVSKNEFKHYRAKLPAKGK